MTPTGITSSELSGRRERLLEHVQAQALTGYVLFEQAYIQYFTGFNFLSTERPVVFAESASGETMAFVPEFEVDRTRAETEFERVESYPEYPGTEHPMNILSRVLAGMGIGRAIGADQDGYPGILGYQGPALSDVTGAAFTPLNAQIEALLAVKSPAEVELIRESARWCEHAHRLLQEYSLPGATEGEVSLRAGHEATLAMLDALVADFGQQGSPDGASAGYRGQIGKRSAWAHAVAHNIEFREGDVLVTETSAPVWGYNAELERTMIIGTPTAKMRDLFSHMVEAQRIAFDTFTPGVTCADVDSAVLRYFADNDLLPYWRQHVGHAIGLRNHEAPFLDVGDHTPIEPGMVFTIEPGVYADDILTDYSRDLESLTIPV